MTVRRGGCVVGLLALVILDLLALDDVTTAGARLPEVAFLIASIPALVTLGVLALRPPPAFG